MIFSTQTIFVPILQTGIPQHEFVTKSWTQTSTNLFSWAGDGTPLPGKKTASWEESVIVFSFAFRFVFVFAFALHLHLH